MTRKIKAVPPKAPTMILTNTHPADELADLREEIALLTKQADELRALLLQDGADLVGFKYAASIKSQTRETLDRKAITEAFGEAAIAPFIKTTVFKVVNLTERKNAEA